MNTWNIIFIALDVNDEYKDKQISSGKYKKYDNELNAITNGINNFKEDLLKTDKSVFENINITYLEFLQSEQIASVHNLPKVFKNSGTNRNELIKVDSKDLKDFDCLSTISYSNFIKNYVNPKEDLKEKYILIFLAHSFGGGLTYVFNSPDDQLEKINTNKPKNYPFLSIKAIGEIIKRSFPNRSLDCFYGINCSFQSVENNFVFRDKVENIIGSEIPIFTTLIKFFPLFELLNSNSELETTELMSKYLDNLLEEVKNGINKDRYPFLLSLTIPKNSIQIENKLNGFFKEFNDRDFDFDKLRLAVESAVHLCVDPTPENYLNCFDAIQFFTFLNNEIEKDNELKFLLPIIVDIISSFKEIIYSQVQNNLSIKETTINSEVKTFNPNGILILIPKKQNSLMELLIKLNRKNSFGVKDKKDWATFINYFLKEMIVIFENENDKF